MEYEKGTDAEFKQKIRLEEPDFNEDDINEILSSCADKKSACVSLKKNEIKTRKQNEKNKKIDNQNIATVEAFNKLHKNAQKDNTLGL